MVLGSPPAQMIKEYSQHEPLRLITLDDASLKQLKSLYPYVQQRILPAQIYHGSDTQVQTIEIASLWIADKSLPNALAHDLARALWQSNRTRLYYNDRTNILLPDFSTITNLQLLPLHHGAKQYYESIGPAN